MKLWVRNALTVAFIAVAWDLSWALIEEVAGFDLIRTLAKYVTQTPASSLVVGLRVGVALAIGYALVLTFSRLQSPRKTKPIRAAERAWASGILMALVAATLLAYKAGQDNPSLYTLTGLFSPIKGARIEPGKLVIEIHSEKLYEYRHRLGLVAVCTVNPHERREFFGNELRQRSDVMGISIPLEIDLVPSPGLVLFDRFCKEGYREIDCRIRAVELKDTGKPVDHMEGRYFGHGGTITKFTPAEISQFCGSG